MSWAVFHATSGKCVQCFVPKEEAEALAHSLGDSYYADSMTQSDMEYQDPQ